MPEATELRRIQRAGRTLDYALTAVAAGALCFSTVNVALLAVAHGVPAWIAWLLEPLVGIALWAVLTSDAVLSRYGRSAGAWAWCLRTFAGVATLTLNIWGSVFTGTGRHLAWAPDPAGILLHAIPPVLLILLAEAAPRYRAAFAAITTDLTTPDPPPAPATAPAVPAPAEESSPAHAGDTADGAPAETAASGRPPSPSPTGAVSGRCAGAVPPTSALELHPPSAARGQKPSRRTHRHRTDARARSILLLEPDITGADLARRLGVAPRSGQRILERITKAEES